MCECSRPRRIPGQGWAARFIQKGLRFTINPVMAGSRGAIVMTKKKKLIVSGIVAASAFVLLSFPCGSYLYYSFRPDIVGTITAITPRSANRPFVEVQVSYRNWREWGNQEAIIFWVYEETPLYIRKGWGWKKYEGSRKSLAVGKTIEVWDLPKFMLMSYPPQCSGFGDMVVWD